MATGDMDSAATKPSRLTAWGRWSARLEMPVDAASVGVFRIVFGTAVAIDAWRYLAYAWVDLLYIRPAVHFHYFGFDFVRPLPGGGMRLCFWALSVLALLVAAGLLYRVAAATLFVVYLYVFLLDQAAYMNHHYLMLLLAFLLACMPAHRAYSLDRLRSKSRVESRESRAMAREPARLLPAVVPRWCIEILHFQLALVYLYGGIAKLDPDWLRGEPMRTTLEAMASGYPEPVIALVPLLAYFIAFAGLLADLAIPALLLSRRTVFVGLGLAVLFHLANAAVLNIGVFSYLMIGLLPIFLSPSWPRQVARVLGWRPASAPMPLPASASATRTRPLVFVVLHLYVLVQLVVPLRHWLYPGPVRWTEEGHRFAWRMMLRTKRSQVRLLVTDPATQRTWSIDPAADLTPVQLRELETAPDIVLQYAHHHRDRLRREGIEPVVRVDWTCSLNGREPRRLADPDADLANVERSWRPSSWILPLNDG